MAKLKIKMAIEIELPLNPAEQKKTPEQALKSTIAYAKEYPWEFLDQFLEQSWQVTGESILDEP